MTEKSSDRAVATGESLRLGKMLRRSLRRRCPVCGEGRQFTLWFRMQTRCRRCGLRFERIEGHWLGAIGINTIVSFGVLLVALVVGLVATFPEFPIAQLVTINVAVAVTAPLLFWPFSRMVWTAIDIAMRPLASGEADPTRQSLDADEAM